MSRSESTNNHFNQALRKARKALGLSQEDFDVVSSRTYVSSLERALKSPTLAKVDELAAVLGIHPLTLLTLAYSQSEKFRDVASTLEVVSNELLNLFE